MKKFSVKFKAKVGIGLPCTGHPIKVPYHAQMGSYSSIHLD